MQRGDRVCPTDTAGVMDAAGRFEGGIIKRQTPRERGLSFLKGSKETRYLQPSLALANAGATPVRRRPHQ